MEARRKRRPPRPPSERKLRHKVVLGLLSVAQRFARRFRRPIIDLKQAETCDLGWQPSVLAPIFYGLRDYAPGAGLGTPCRVFFPSTDGAVDFAPILEGCGRYPLVVFAHGQCTEVDHYKKWYPMLANLARCGYVVASPRLPGVELGAWQADVPVLREVLSWMENQWEFRHMLMPRPARGVMGHSFGALCGSELAVEIGCAAYVSLSGDWHSVSNEVAARFAAFGFPNLFTWGTGFDPNAQLANLWDSLPAPRHKVEFIGAGHFDYLSPDTTTCQGFPGECDLVPAMAADVVSLFFGKYLPPESWPALGGQIPDSLEPPTVALTYEQQFFAGFQFPGFKLIVDHPGCAMRITWALADGTTDAIVRPC
jgi:hypothetical protein